MFEHNLEMAPPIPQGGQLVGIHAGIDAGIGRRRCFCVVVPVVIKCEGVISDPKPLKATARVTGIGYDRVKPSDPKAVIGSPIDPRVMNSLGPDVRVSG